MAERRKTPSDSWEEVFLASLAAGMTVTAAAKSAGVSRWRVYAVRNADPAFATAWDDAWEQGTDLLEAEAWRRAREGNERPIMYRGERVGSVREFSDTLMITLLKARRPDVYRERADIRHQHVGRPGDEELARAREVGSDRASEAAILRVIDGGES